MKFYVPINVANENESQTMHIVNTESTCARTNKRKLREYFLAVGVPSTNIKHVMKSMGFWGDNLGIPFGVTNEPKNKTSKGITSVPRDRQKDT